LTKTIKKKIFEGYTYSGWLTNFFWHKGYLSFPNIECTSHPPLQTKVKIIIKEIKDGSSSRANQ